MQERDGRKRERRDGWGEGEKASFKGLTDTKGRRMTATRLKPEEKTDEKDGC